MAIMIAHAQRRKLNAQTRLAADYQRQLNRFRVLLEVIPRNTNSTATVSVKAFGGFLIRATSEEQVRAYIISNSTSALRFVEHAGSFTGEVTAPFPADQLHAVDEEHLPFHVLGWLAGGDISS